MILRSEQIREPDGDSGAGMNDGDEADRRQHTRNMRVMRVARLAVPDVHTEGLGMVRDVSPGGMMIDAHFDLELGQTVSIALLDNQELSGTVAWKEGSMIGVSFADEVPVDQILAKPSAQPDGKRAPPAAFCSCPDSRPRDSPSTRSSRAQGLDSENGVRSSQSRQFRPSSSRLRLRDQEERSSNRRHSHAGRWELSYRRPCSAKE